MITQRLQDSATCVQAGLGVFGGSLSDLGSTITHSLVWGYSTSLSDAEITTNFNFADSEIASHGSSLKGYAP